MTTTDLQPTLIAPFSTGLNTDNEPWMCPADAFTEADNVHISNGYVEKRSGYRIFGKLKTLDATVVITDITNAANGTVTTAVNHGYVNGDKVFITGVLGMTQVNGRYFSITVVLANTFLLNDNTTTYGVYAGAGTAAKNIDKIDRVMGIQQFLKEDGEKETFAFGTERAYKYDTTSKHFLQLDTANIFDGGETDYIWALNIQSPELVNRMYFTNGLEFAGGLNGIRYYDGSGTGNITTSFLPVLGGGRTLYGSKLLFALHSRIIALSTFEHDGAVVKTYPQRARWCQAQTPSNWDDTVRGGGGYVDAPTGDQIITARPLQDEIIVFFTTSVWALQPVSDPATPFRWVKLNDFRAADAKMSAVGYDRYVLSVGIRGVSASDGVETQRIDQRIQNFVTNEININHFGKVFALRSYAKRRTWILYPDIERDENTSALIYDEDSKAFTTYSILMNCLGYGVLSTDLTLEDFTAENNLDLTIGEMAEETILSYFWQGREEILLGGNIIGEVFVLETEGSDQGFEIDSTIITAGWNPYQSEGAQSVFNYVDIYVDTHKKTIANIDFYKNDEASPYASQTIDCLPDLDYVSTIEDITQDAPGIVTASNHGLATGDIVYIYGVDGMDEVNGGPYTITLIDQNSFYLDVDTTLYSPYLGSGKVFLREFYRTKTWKRAFSGATGFLHKIKITSSGLNCPLRISGFKPVFKKRGMRVVT